MRLRIHTSDFPELVIERDDPRMFYPTNGLFKEHSVTLNNRLGRGYYKEIYFDGIHIGHGNASLSQQTLVDFDSQYETVEMHFSLKGFSRSNNHNMAQKIDFSPCQHNIIYANHLKGTMEWNDDGLQIFEINLQPAFFAKYLPEDHFFQSFKKAIEKGSSCLIQNENNWITNEMYEIIHAIIHCNRTGIYKKMYLEAKVIELLLLQLEQIQDINTSATSSKLRKKDIDKLYAVREFIIQNMAAPHTLNDLAHQVGTNEQTLKKGFRELFNTTVFGFWNDLKMDEARKMLQDNGMSVSEVSDAVGYKNPQHFTTAFKRKFGIVPSHLKRD